ncbi:MarR family transcriptional regulator (plasmid) [Deinococcus taeanensis]|uniref:MarR family transcriptional regulator n=1 Tax=Deinococcus taeanensis TaxID=2737050 RepID=UPI001CDC55C5|nr:helix-turn-helix domain-containing protein [Deinococcus taeanensis]UBV44746.1 MarR family transcriptional regulator [Deinococcus taeanensis]
MTRVTVSAPEAMDLFLDLAKLRLFAPFLAGPITVTDAARLTGVSASALNYWVKRALDWNLLERVGEDRPARYRAVATDFVMNPTAVMPFEDMLERRDRSSWARMLSGYAREYGRVSADWVFRVYLEGGALLHRDLVPAEAMTSPAPPPELPLNEWGVLRLSRAQARVLKERLEETLQAFFEEASDDQQDEKYLFHVAVVRDGGAAS